MQSEAHPESTLEIKAQTHRMIAAIIGSVVQTKDPELMKLVNHIGLMVRRLTLCTTENNKHVASAIGLDLKNITIFGMQYVENKKSGYEAKELWLSSSIVNNMKTLLATEDKGDLTLSSQEITDSSLCYLYEYYSQMSCHEETITHIRQFIETYDLLISTALSYNEEPDVPSQELIAVHDVLKHVLLKLIMCMNEGNTQEVKSTFRALSKLFERSINLLKRHPYMGENLFLIMIIPTVIQLRIKKKIRSLLNSYTHDWYLDFQNSLPPYFSPSESLLTNNVKFQVDSY